MRPDLGGFGDDDAIGVPHGQPLGPQPLHHGLQERRAVGILEARIVVRKQPADVALPGRAQERVDERMHQDVRVGVADETLVKGNLDAADDEPPARGQSVQVVPQPDPSVQEKPPPWSGPGVM